MLLGIWKNVEDLELHISLEELEAILQASHERERRYNRFHAALKGIDIDKGDEDDARERFERVQTRATARLTGQDANVLEFNELGLEVETE